MVMWDRPDNLLLALKIGRNKAHIWTYAGSYSELAPRVDLLDRKQKEQKFLEANGELLIYLQNCLKSKKDFQQLYNLCLEQRFTINMVSIFVDLYRICNTYAASSELNKPKFNIQPSVYQDAIKTKYYLSKWGKEFDLNRISSPRHFAPIEFGMFLQTTMQPYAL
jgi:hypothetical protein